MPRRLLVAAGLALVVEEELNKLSPGLADEPNADVGGLVFVFPNKEGVVAVAVDAGACVPNKEGTVVVAVDAGECVCVPNKEGALVLAVDVGACVCVPNMLGGPVDAGLGEESNMSLGGI